MDRTTTSLSTPAERPSALRAFLGGFGTGAFNGSLMMGIFSVGSLALGALGTALNIAGLAALSPIGIWPAVAAVVATGLFSGVMGVKRAFTETADEHTSTTARSAHTQVLVPTMGHGVAPQMDIAEVADMDTGRRTDWAERTGQRSNNMQQILANGAMNDKDRASAILAERERTASAHASLN
jgi:hypothetical protein